MKWKLRFWRRTAKAARPDADVSTDGTEQFHREVFPSEIRYLEDRWQAAGSDHPAIDDADGASPASANNLVGLALSGGGIRSATFNLGLLQSLHRRGIFRHVDYLSTVSGGGFLGSAVSTLMSQKARRRQPEPRADFPIPDSDQEAEAPEVTYLRNNSNYLATNGLLDYLRLVGVLIRGILLNFLVLVPLILVCSMIVLLLYGQVLLDRIQEDDDVQGLAELLERHWTGIEKLEGATVASLTRSLEDWSMLAVHRDKRTADVLRWLRGTTSGASPLIVGGPGEDPVAYRFRSDATASKIVRALWDSRTLQSLDALEEIEVIAREAAAGYESVLGTLGALDDAGALRVYRGADGAVRGVEPALAALRRAGLVTGGDALGSGGNAGGNDIPSAPAGVAGVAGVWKLSLTTPDGQLIRLPMELESTATTPVASAAAPAAPGRFTGPFGRFTIEAELTPGTTRRQLLHELYVRAMYKPQWLEKKVHNRSGRPLAYWEFVELAGVRHELESKTRGLRQEREKAAEAAKAEATGIPKPPASTTVKELKKTFEKLLLPMPDDELTGKIDAALKPLLETLNKKGTESSAIGPAADKVARALYYQGLLNPEWFDPYVVNVVGEAVSQSKQLWGTVGSWIRQQWTEPKPQPQPSSPNAPGSDEGAEADEPGKIWPHSIRAYRSYPELAPAASRWDPHLIRLPWTVKIGLVGLLWIALFPLLLWLRRLLTGVGLQSWLLLLCAGQILPIGALVAFEWFEPSLTELVASLALIGIAYWLARPWLGRRLTRPGSLLLLAGVPLVLIGALIAFEWSKSLTPVVAGLAVIGITYWLMRHWLGRLLTRPRGRFLLLVLGAAPLLLIGALIAFVLSESLTPVVAGLAVIGITYWLMLRLRRAKSALWWRDVYERSFSSILILISGIAWVELQPYLIYHYSHLQLDVSWTVALGAASLLSALSAGPAMAVLKRSSKTIAMVVVAMLGPVLPLLIYIHIALYSLYNDDLWNGPYSLDKVEVLIYFGSAALLFHFINLPLDVNSTSMHSFYRDRLSRAYLIGHDKDGQIRPEDDLSLRDICLEGSGAPYHLLNVALNLQGTSDPAMQRRNSDFFTFSRDYIGGARTGYCKTQDIERVFPHLHLSTATAVSAAAAAPNMGTFTFGPLVVLMALLNIRLGFWLPNPSRVNLWTRPGTSRLRSLARSIGFAVVAFFGSFRARPGAYSLIKEMLSMMHDRSRFVNLSDGGHIENTGAYELLRRRCRFIVVGDAEADPEMRLTGLATLMRYARIDLGVEIEIHVDDLRPGPDGQSRQHCSIGLVHYPEVDGRPQEKGLLLYVKSSLTGDEDQVVAEYRARSTSFPHESTADQAFGEGQFEAYRDLGFHIGETLFDQSARIDSFEEFSLWFEGLRVKLCPGLASHLSLAEIDAELAEISELLRQPRVDHYFYELYPDLKPHDYEPESTAGSGDAFRQVFHVVGRQLRLMQTLFVALELDQSGNLVHPSNRGWMNLFRRWAQAQTFKRIYLRTISTCSSPFQQFCESALGLEIRFHWEGMSKKGILQGMSEHAGGQAAALSRHEVGRLIAEVEGTSEKLLIGHATLLSSGVSVSLRDGYQGTGMLARAELALRRWALEHQVPLELEMPSGIRPESGETSPLEIVEPDAEDPARP